MFYSFPSLISLVIPMKHRGQHPIGEHEQEAPWVISFLLILLLVGLVLLVGCYAFYVGSLAITLCRVRGRNLLGRSSGLFLAPNRRLAGFEGLPWGTGAGATPTDCRRGSCTSGEERNPKVEYHEFFVLDFAEFAVNTNDRFQQAASIAFNYIIIRSNYHFPSQKVAAT